MFVLAIFRKKIKELRLKFSQGISSYNYKVCRALRYFANLLISASSVSGYILISAFALLVGIPVGITSSAVGKFFLQCLQKLKS